MSVITELSRLESAGLIRLVQYEPELEYLFRHALVQDAAYGTLLTADRKRLHHVVGEAVESLYADRLDELSAMLARHFEQAGDQERALGYYTRAGEAALASYANVEAESLFRSALALPNPPAQRVDLLSQLGEALYGQSRFDEAIATWREGIEICRLLDDKDGIARLYARSARAAWYADDTPGGLRLCEVGLAAVEGALESVDQARLIHEAARAYLFNGHREEAIRLCRQALQMAERLGAVDVQADTLTTIGILPDQPADATLSALRKAVELAESADLLQIAFRAYHNLGIMTGVFEADLQRARGYLVRAAELSHRRGSVSEELVSQLSVRGYTINLGELAAAEAHGAELEALVATLPDPETAFLEIEASRPWLLSLKGEWSEALEMLRQILPEARRRGNLQTLGGMCNLLAELQMELDRLGKLEGEARLAALAEAEAAVREAMETGAVAEKDEVGSLCQLSTLHARRDQREEAHRLLTEAQEKARKRSTAWTEQSLQHAARSLAEAEGRWADALALTERMAAFEARLGRRWHWARILMDWAAIHARLGEPTDLQRAQALLREARNAFAEMGATGYADEAAKRLEALRGEMHNRLLAQGQALGELAVAGRIQAGLLPEEVPTIAGWQLAAALEPARETSGDFYDFIPLPGKRLGLVVADVADKGAGAALYMALSRTLIRTYATRYPDQPDLALGSANQRILAETHTGMFVTVFYGVLNTETGSFLYCNAGHIPPLLLNAEGSTTLGRTGLPLGILEDAVWETGSVDLAPCDALLLYTDGVTEAQARDGVQFGQDRLLAAIEACHAASGVAHADAEKLRDAVLAAVHRFVGDAPRFDDVTLMVISRE
jgi:serine phosphatase RsbU (regulator of sigma subunit)/tetratricopeptide (TPR) repeat protein